MLENKTTEVDNQYLCSIQQPIIYGKVQWWTAIYSPKQYFPVFLVPQNIITLSTVVLHMLKCCN